MKKVIIKKGFYSSLFLLVSCIVGFLFSILSCTFYDNEPLLEEPILELDARLPIDMNGYYHLSLNPATNQTTHRISGKVINITEPTKISWESNLYWWLLKGQVVAEITKTYVNYFTGEITYVNLPTLTNWQDVLVPTINTASYVGADGEINTVIAPIYRMKNDTLIVTAQINEWEVTQSIKIVLE
jgi:hypothetical protein